MTSADSTTLAPIHNPPAAEVLAVARAWRQGLAIVTPDWKANHIAAQAAGDLAYEAASSASQTLEDCADAYHGAYVGTMAALGTPAACCCVLCAGFEVAA
jgi:hypothetical protein